MRKERHSLWLDYRIGDKSCGFEILGRKGQKKPTVSPDLVRRVLMLADRRGRDARPITSSGRYRKDLLSRHNQFTGQMRKRLLSCEHGQGYLSLVCIGEISPMILCVGPTKNV